MSIGPLVVALALTLAVGSARSAVPSALEAWIPPGWKLIANATGDLNGDATEDAVLVLEQTDPANFKANDDLGAPILNLNPRRLLVLFNETGGYRPVFSRDRLLPGENDEISPCLLDPLMQDGGLSISRGRLMIDLRSWSSCGSYGVSHQKFTFRFDDGRFRLIGYDTWEFSRGSGDGSSVSVNFLTGQRKTTTGQNEFKPAQPTISWDRIPVRERFHLDEISLDCIEPETRACAWLRYAAP